MARSTYDDNYEDMLAEYEREMARTKNETARNAPMFRPDCAGCLARSLAGRTAERAMMLQ